MDSNGSHLGRNPERGSTGSQTPAPQTQQQQHREQHSQHTNRKKARNRRFTRKLDYDPTAIVNLSNTQLSEDQKKLLSKGLNFIPTPRRDHPSKILQDYLLFDRRLRIHYAYFKDNDPDQTPSSSQPTPSTSQFRSNPLKPSTGWTPQPGADMYLDSYRHLTQESLLKELQKESKITKYNLTLKERRAIKELNSNDAIVIRPADKGGAIVILNKTDYLAEGERQLNDPIKKFYKPLDADPTKEYSEKIKKKLNEAVRLGNCDEETKKSLMVKHPRISNFYMLPKIHKEERPPQGRGIVNSIKCLTENLSTFVYQKIYEMTLKTPYNIKDTTHFLNIFNSTEIEPGDMIVILDVRQLYNNIPHTQGIQAVVELMTEFGADPKDIYMTKLALYFVLTMNYFTFNGKMYLQQKGTAMGTVMAPAYANAFMYRHETRMIGFYPYKPKLWRRFIDDAFMIWPHGEEKLKDFIHHINNFDDDIKFTVEYSYEKASFLDVELYKDNNGTWQTKVYRKPTDRRTYLHYHSAHPKKTKDAIPYGLMVRAKRICSTEEDYKMETEKIITSLKSRNYPQDLLNKTLNVVSNLDRDNLLQQTNREEKQQIRLITNFNPQNPDLKKIITEHTRLLERTRKKAIQAGMIQVTYSKCSNLRALIVKTKEPITEIARSLPCYRCVTCPYMQRTNKIASTHTGKEYDIRGYHNCQSTHVIYAATCTVENCGKQYVGETSNSLNSRFRGHHTDIRYKKEKPMAIHHNTANHTGNDYQIAVIDSERDKNKRLRLEEAWMLLLDTQQPRGLNIQF